MGYATAAIPVPTASPPRLTLADRIDQKVFDAIYSQSLVYNTCWEDPAVDRQALDLGSEDTMLVITSAGCNVLDYALAGAGRIHAVDANPRQNALLELKLAGIRRLDFADFFAIFGHGMHRRFREIYRDCLRSELSPFARAYWDRCWHWFVPRRVQGTFYFRGLSGLVARAFREYLRLCPRLRDGIEALLEARTLDEQREIYARAVEPVLFTGAVNWALGRQFTMSLLGVPHPQRREVESQHPDGIAGFVRDSIGYVAQQLPLWDNYFWTVYLRGYYTHYCCPEYLKRRNFALLKAGLEGRIVVHTCSVTEFLRSTDERITKFVLLDHMDWMSSYHPQALVDEWRAILSRAAPGARLICRSAHAKPVYLRQLAEAPDACGRPLGESIALNPRLARRLQRGDRVHTYAGFHIADLRPLH